MVTIRLTNTKTRRKEDFLPINPSDVRMYVCGPTVYDRAHLGNARPVVVFDVLNRLLRHVYGADHVTYVRNFTDVDDKINAEALRRQKAGSPGTLEDLIHERTEETIAWYHADMDALGALRPDHEPRATEYIEEMKVMIAELIEKKFAYVVPATIGHNSRAQYVYLDSTRVPSHSFLSVEAFAGAEVGYGYGELSGRSVDDMIAGSRSEMGEGKRNPMDSVLWKPSTIDQPGWEGPWGFGRPGWHIECSAMSRKLLGKRFDIHGGGLDLLFPHHENELAQCAACDGPEASAKYWLHNEMLQVEGKKMSKSLGNFFTVRDLLEQGVPGEVIRFVFLMTHYRSPMDWTAEKARQAEAELGRWANAFSVRHDVLDSGSAIGSPESGIVEALSDDLNTALALTRLQALARLVDNSAAYLELDEDAQRNLDKSFIASAALLGFRVDELARSKQKQGLAVAKHEVLLEELRAAAMSSKDFSAVDALKSALIAAGVEVRMTKARVELVPGPTFDPAKLAAIQ